MPWPDLRSFLDRLEAQGDLLRIVDPVTWQYEIVALTRETSDVQGPALLFERVQDSRYPVLSGLFAARRRVALALEVDERDLYDAYRQREEQPLPPVVVDDGACQEIVLRGDEIDLRELPILLHYEKDGGRYVTAGLQVARHPLSGQRNVSIHRMLLLDRNHLSVYAPPGRHTRAIIERNLDDGRPTEIATVIGAEPVLQIATQARVPLGTDEYAIAGGLRGEPLHLVRACTLDLEVPAHAEIVIEGRTLPGEYCADGPFGEYPGTYSAVKQAPVLEVTAITMRRGAIYQNALTGMPMTENHWMMQPAATAMVYREAYKVSPEVQAVHVTPGGATRHHVIVSIKKRHDAEARNLILALLAAPLGAKHVVVVDEDIDVFDALQVEWAINTRVQPDRDVLIIPNLHSPTLDPSAPAERTTAKMGIDATAPLGKLEDFTPPRIPGAERYRLARYLGTGHGARPSAPTE
ncbi:MAG TPA: UbiD family decarboxylase [Chloroflexota bacterium]|nr:UbiD family decarboxylase [Chloroflexota bacterium]